MNPSLREFRDRYRELLLNLLWRQWSALGVAGQSTGREDRVIDPEALLLLTCTLGRQEPRLFDEVLDWLQENGRFINILRLKRMLRKEKLSGQRVLRGIAGLMSKGTEALKWKTLAELPRTVEPAQGLFFQEDGKPLPVSGEPEPQFFRYGFRRGPLRLRSLSQHFRPNEGANLMLQLRALFGVNSRCEAVLYLLTHESGHPSQIARDAFYFERAVQNTLVDMHRSGAIQLRRAGREKHYWLKPEPWWALLNRVEPHPHWVTWPPLFSALERIWLKLADPKLPELDPLLQSSELRQLMVDVRPALERAGSDKSLSDDRAYPGETYLPIFMEDVARLLG